MTDTITRIDTVSDLMRAAAAALEERNADELVRLADVARNWLQPDAERDAQQLLLGAMADAALEIEAAR